MTSPTESRRTWLNKAECVIVIPSVLKFAIGIGGDFGGVRRVPRAGSRSVREASLFLSLIFLGHCFGLISCVLQLRGLCFHGSSPQTSWVPPIKQPLALEAEATRFSVPPRKWGRKRRNKSCIYMFKWNSFVRRGLSPTGGLLEHALSLTGHSRSGGLRTP